jgi:hypothetical protein
MAQYHLVRCRTDKYKWNELIKLINDIDWFEKVLIPSHLVHPVATTVSVHYLIKKNAPMNVFKALLSKHPTPQHLCDELATGGNTPLHQFLQKINLWPPLEQIEIFKLLKRGEKELGTATDNKMCLTLHKIVSLSPSSQRTRTPCVC